VKKYGIIFEPVNINDLKDIQALQPEGWGDILPHICFYITQPFCHPFKLIRNKRICAIGTAIIFGKTAWLGHIIVVSNCRRQGLGLILVNLLIEYLENRDIRTVSLIATDMGASVYKKAGFREVAKYFFFETKQILPETILSNDFIIPYNSRFKEAFLKLDNRISGETRGELLEGFLADTQLYIRNNILKGYYIPSLVEGFIAAESKRAGVSLLRLNISRTGKITVPYDNEYAISFLKNNGYSEVKRAERMSFGRPLDTNLEKVYSRIGGNLG